MREFTFDTKTNNFNNTIKSMNDNIVDLSQKLNAEKEKNNQLINNNNIQNKVYEIKRNIFDNINDKNNNNESSLKLKMIKNYIENIYNNI